MALYRTLNVPVCIYWGELGSVPTTFLCMILSHGNKLWTQGVDPSWAIQHAEDVDFAKLVLSNQELELLLSNKSQIPDTDEEASDGAAGPVASDEDLGVVEEG
ncbi:hypothetical protein AAF712_009471 [Marasmius tenuissimus]|uniref:Uncharacterized protein n=1 Tax=Marasmius tenuissimus TaxID=585030 RepID=A0ABR2ZRH7_9AGAR